MQVQSVQLGMSLQSTPVSPTMLSLDKSMMLHYISSIYYSYHADLARRNLDDRRVFRASGFGMDVLQWCLLQQPLAVIQHVPQAECRPDHTTGPSGLQPTSRMATVPDMQEVHQSAVPASTAPTSWPIEHNAEVQTSRAVHVNHTPGHTGSFT
jgi:hypothetical protein